MSFINNSWYVCAWPEEITAETILARTICGQAMIFFRDADGTVAALEDRCCHRQMPLSQGWIEDATVRCGYHGMRYDSTGKCVEIPGQPNIPPRARVNTYPMIEKYGWLWVWPGDAPEAAKTPVPVIFERNDHPDWTSGGGTTFLKCHYQLISDNLLDLTHETYIHRSSLGNQAVVEHPITVDTDETSVTVTRLIPNHDPAPFWKKALGKGDVMCDRWQIIYFEPPANLVLDVGVTPTGRPREEGAQGCNLNAITPETEHSSWYFWAFARRFDRDQDELTQKLTDQVTAIFEEDRGAVEAVHEVMKRNRGRGVIDINADAGSIAARRIVEKIVQNEHADAEAAAE